MKKCLSVKNNQRMQPSSLSLAERLAFFSSLCQSASCGTTTGSARVAARSSIGFAPRSPSYASMERTPRSSIAGSCSSTSVTPTPTSMEYTPNMHELRLQAVQQQLEQHPEQRQPVQQQQPSQQQQQPEQQQQEQQPLQQQSQQQQQQLEKQQQPAQQQPGQPQQQQQNPQQHPQHNGFHELSRSATAPTTTTGTTTSTGGTAESLLDAKPTAQRRVRLRTVGKLVLPDTFLSDRNNNNNSINNSNSSSNHSNSNGYRNSCLGRMQTVEDIHISMGVRTIGKIKSPFIEQQQQQQQQMQQQQLMQCTPTGKFEFKTTSHSLMNGSSDSGDDVHGSDSGKENCAANQQQQSEPPSAPELLRKLTLLTQITVQQRATPQPVVNRRHTTEVVGTTTPTTNASPSTATTRGPSNVDERIAKYFGPTENFNSTTTVHKTRSMPTTTTNNNHKPQEALNEHVRLPATAAAAAAPHSSCNNTSGNFGLGISIVQRRRELLKRTRAMSLEVSATDGCISPTATPSPKRAHSPGALRLRTKLRSSSIASFEDIVITPDELHAASQEFKRLCGEILGT
ncbi:putative mediator of RNA polymerase II transcription subunit 26 [Drosophila grimshawi]|uniref:putative mediator of RNA polymerase II transcription subunit 26 n=1 Tax=Drosophila grimshawi TaxID=7222 RepID=UPI000C86EFCF|nr:putative mediator of RNA polymerase II transcription subunit 26 [Drosophila grimshawi]